MKIYKVKYNLANGERTDLVAQFSKAEEKWLDFVGSDDATLEMTTAEQRDEHIRRTKVMLEPFGVGIDEITKFEDSRRVMYVGKKIEGDTYAAEIVGEIEQKTTGINNFIDWLNAHAEARNQFECYRDMVSGVWSIGAKDFCKKYGLDYESAYYDAQEQNMEDFDLYYENEKNNLERQIGKLTDEQAENLNESLRENYDFDDGTRLWANIMHILEIAPNLKQYYDEYVHEDYEEYFV